MGIEDEGVEDPSQTKFTDLGVEARSGEERNGERPADKPTSEMTGKQMEDTLHDTATVLYSAIQRRPDSSFTPVTYGMPPSEDSDGTRTLRLQVEGRDEELTITRSNIGRVGTKRYSINESVDGEESHIPVGDAHVDRKPERTLGEMLELAAQIDRARLLRDAVLAEEEKNAA